MELRPIDRHNYNECIELRVKDFQEGFVASNAYSLVQAAYEPELYPLGVYHRDEMIGFILYDYDDELKGWSMSRFMIDASHQGSGLGKAALREFLEYFREKHPDVKELYTSAEINNPAALSLYEKADFEKGEAFSYHVGEKEYNEIRMKLLL